MDHHPHDNASEQTLPSQHVENFSNLSTRPNISEQNDPVFDEPPIQQRPSEIYTDRQHHQPLYSERAATHRSQSFGQGSNQHPAPFPVPLISNQHHPQQQRRENSSPPNNPSSEKVFQFNIISDEWERELIEAERRREEMQSFLNQDNQPLLSQRSEIQTDHQIFQNNELLLSQHSAFSQNQSRHQEDQLVSLQNKEHHELNSIDQSNQQAKSNASNQVKYSDPPNLIKELLFEEDSRSQRSNKSSSLELPQQPLFEMNNNDESQSNLLKFGFTVGKKNVFTNEQATSNSQRCSIEDHESRSNRPFVKNQQPMDIQSTSLRQAEPTDKDSRSNIHPQQGSIQIKVSNCSDENINSTAKNNDIYGIVVQQFNQNHQNNQQQENLPSQVKQRDEANLENHPAQQSQWSNHEEPSIKIDQKLQQCKQEHSKDQPQDKKVNKSSLEQAKQVLKAHGRSREIAASNLPFQQIVQQMQQIIRSQIPGTRTTENGEELLLGHVDFLFVKPLSEVGNRIMADGKTAINLIELILAKEENSQLKQILRKYLVLTLASKISTNQEAFAYYHPVADVRPRNRQPVQRVSPFKEPSVTHSQNRLVVDQSVQAVNGSSTKKHENQMMDMEEQLRPVKRTVQSKSIQKPPSPRSGKVTRKTRIKSKGKGKTTSKKSTVKFEDEPQQEVKAQAGVSEAPKSPPKRVSRKSGNKSIKKDEETIDVENLGSKFTYVLRQNNRSNQKQLIQRRVSQRLASKDSHPKQQAKVKSRSNSRKESLRKNSHSSKKKYTEEEEKNVDYIKQHIREIYINTSMLEDKYRPLTQQDEEIAKLLQEYEEIESQESSSNSYAITDHPEPEDNTMSVQSNHSQRSNSMARIQEFKKNLSKYKVGEIPISILRIVDPDVNNHGIYALLELGKISQIVYNAKFAVTPITNLERASKRLIDEDLNEVKRQVGNEEKDNLVYMKPTASTLDLIREEKEKRTVRRQ